MRGVNMAPAAAKTQPPKARKRVDVDPSLLKRGNDGSTFAHCEKCKQDVAVATFDMHDCTLKTKIMAVTTKLKASAQEAEAKKSETEVRSKRKGDINGTADKPAKVPKVKAKKPSKKAAKDPNVPKRPASGFFIFMETFRKTYKEENPDVKGVAAVGKAGGLKWKQMSEKEKAPFNDEALQRKATYEMTMAAYKKASSKTEEEEEEEVSAGSEEDQEDVEDAGEVDVDDADEE